MTDLMVTWDKQYRISGELSRAPDVVQEPRALRKWHSVILPAEQQAPSILAFMLHQWGNLGTPSLPLLFLLLIYTSAASGPQIPALSPSTNKCSLKVSLSSLPRERISLVSLGWAFNWLTNQKLAAAWIQGDGVMGMTLCGVAEVLCSDWKCSRCPEGQSPQPLIIAVTWLKCERGKAEITWSYRVESVAFWQF